ncbi:MAG: DUF885 domain-containing protein [Pseudomonadota bacterium]|nr:DUF885 domain-containing protein [Pseudomonadota bacterium]
MRIKLLGAAAVLALAACTQGAPSGGNASTAASGLPTADWPSFRDAFINGWFKIDPANAAYQGKHEYDGELGDWSPAGLKRQGDFLRDAIAKAQAFDPAKLSGPDAFERDYLINVAQGKLFWLEDADQPHTNPAWYINAGLDPNVYVARNYADAPTRMKAVIKYLQAIPGAAANIKANLKTPMPLSFVNFGAAAFNGYADYYTGDAKAAFASVKDAALQKQFDDAAAPAAKAMKDLGAWVESQRATANQGFALGADRFARMVKQTEDVDASLDQLEAAGQADLKRNQDALKAACAQYAPGATIIACMQKMGAHKAEGGPVVAARRMIPQLRKFVIDHDLVSIPGTEEALVEEAPPYNRQNAAYIDPPGPFDKGVPSVYYIAPPDPAWSKAKQDAFVPGYGTLLFTSVHEVMPGHFVQFLHANRSPSLFGQLFVGYAYAEGWAHYTEQMMWDAGLGNGDAETHVGQLSEALLRDCRYLSAIGMHARGMTMAQSKQMFIDQCYQDEGTADQQASRGTYDPAYLNYTMGKLLIMRLRADWTAKHGGRAGWKAFHDQFLSYGGPPIPLVRKAMMGEPTAKAVF